MNCPAYPTVRFVGFGYLADFGFQMNFSAKAVALFLLYYSKKELCFAHQQKSLIGYTG
tara:strand:- start:71 stop:244 length:174 start_codon:yes stop_codon:yes gene_type:complete